MMINRSLDAIFKPRTIAVVGASKNREKIGHIILHNLIIGGFTGKVYPVNREASVVHSIASYPDVVSIPDEVDLAVICVPAKFVLEVIDDCIKKGVKGVVVITAGFREIGEKGAEIEAQLLEKVRSSGMRMVGPNCMGVINMDPEISMAATFAGQLPLMGKVAFVTQSGAVGGAIIRYSRYSNIGISKFISLGNRADVSSNDMLSYLEIDDLTDTVAMYLEDVGNPKRFVEVARRLTRKKPVIVLKSGRTAVGARAVSSHTGALAGLDVAYDALFEMCGIIRANSVDEMFSMIKVFTEQPKPTNDEVIVLTNGGGPGALAADALYSRNLKLPDISRESKKELSEFLVKEATLANPVDMTGNATSADFGKALDVLARNETAHTIIGMFTPVGTSTFQSVLREIVATKQKYPHKLIIMTCPAWGEKEEDLRIIQEAEVPLFTYPEEAANALSAVQKHLKYQSRPIGTIPYFEADGYTVTQIFDSVRAENRKTLTVDEALKVIESYGIPVCPYQMVKSSTELPQAAARLGYPVVMKLVSKDVTHKTELGGVILDIRDEAQLIASYNWMMTCAKGVVVDGVLLQKFLKGGKEIIIGMAQDPHFGPLLMFGLGGIYVEVLKDVAFRLNPLTDVDAREMIRSIRSFKLLEGVRGQPPADLAKLEEVLLRISKLVTDFPEITEMDINPFIAGTAPNTSFAVDARIMIE